MPRFTDDHGTKREYASESELLAFARRVRKAGGGDFLKEFFPADPNNPGSCLIAQALNFACLIEGANVGPSWVMKFHGDPEQAAAIAAAAGSSLEEEEDDGYGQYTVSLPEKIGNAAHAFDEYKGWTQKYRRTK